jgi:hypothetical protein
LSGAGEELGIGRRTVDGKKYRLGGRDNFQGGVDFAEDELRRSLQVWGTAGRHMAYLVEVKADVRIAVLGARRDDVHGVGEGGAATKRRGDEGTFRLE